MNPFHKPHQPQGSHIIPVRVPRLGSAVQTQVAKPDRQLEARAMGFTHGILKAIDDGIANAGHAPLDAGQKFVVRRVVMAQNAGFIAAVKLEAAALFEAEVAKLKKEIG